MTFVFKIASYWPWDPWAPTCLAERVKTTESGSFFYPDGRPLPSTAHVTGDPGKWWNPSRHVPQTRKAPGLPGDGAGCVPPPVAVGDLLRAGLSSCSMPARAAAPGTPTWRWHLRLGDWHAGLSPFLPLLPWRNILWPRKLVSSAGACGATGFHALLLAVLRIIGLIYVGENRDK